MEASGDEPWNAKPRISKMAGDDTLQLYYPIPNPYTPHLDLSKETIFDTCSLLFTIGLLQLYPNNNAAMQIDPASTRSSSHPTATGQAFPLNQAFLSVFKEIHCNCQFYQRIGHGVVFKHPR